MPILCKSPTEKNQNTGRVSLNEKEVQQISSGYYTSLVVTIAGKELPPIPITEGMRSTITRCGADFFLMTYRCKSTPQQRR